MDYPGMVHVQLWMRLMQARQQQKRQETKDNNDSAMQGLRIFKLRDRLCFTAHLPLAPKRMQIHLLPVEMDHKLLLPANFRRRSGKWICRIGLRIVIPLLPSSIRAVSQYSAVRGYYLRLECTV